MLRGGADSRTGADRGVAQRRYTFGGSHSELGTCERAHAGCLFQFNGLRLGGRRSRPEALRRMPASGKPGKVPVDGPQHGLLPVDAHMPGRVARGFSGRPRLPPHAHSHSQNLASGWT